MYEPGSRNIVLTGFMGAGKSTVGRIVAEALARSFIDMDEAIEVEVGAAIPEIFANRGEPYFRQCEARLVCKLFKLQSLVIATGGGTFLQWKNYELFSANKACVVSLLAPLSEILKRLSNHPYRPLLATRIGNEAALKELFESREAIYQKIPIRIDTSGKTPQEVAASVVSLCGQTLSHQK